VEWDIPLASWVLHRDKYLDELMRLEGRGRYEHLCAGCNTPFPNFRCKDCIHGALWCQACLVKRHSQSPLHVIEVRFLLSIFLFVSDGCNVVVEWPLFSAVFMFSSVIPPPLLSYKTPGHKDFTVIDTNGIHSVAVNFCQCVQVEHWSQLLCMGWWPATPLEPQTCATMAVLRHFHLLNLQGNGTGYSFYRTLEYQTDNTGLNPPLVNLYCLSFIVYIPSLIAASGSSSSLHVDGTQMAPPVRCPTSTSLVDGRMFHLHVHNYI
jgi:hypothetical protein